jgi:hypothetical protein
MGSVIVQSYSPELKVWHSLIKELGLYRVVKDSTEKEHKPKLFIFIGLILPLII